MAEHHVTGQKGEELAAEYLRSKGYEVLETNWRFQQLEADIIAKKAHTLVVAEVKTRTSTLFGEPETFVNRQKQRNLIKAANEYIERKQLDMDVRFDILSVIINSAGSKVNHIEGAFNPLV